MAAKKNTGWQKVNGQNYQVKKSGKVTDAEVKRAKKRVYGNNPPRASDRGVPARVTYPPHPTPRQLNNWERNPGRSDIRGIDAPDTAIITARDSVTIRKPVQQQIGVRSNAIRPTATTKGERYTNPITGKQNYYEVNRISHKVTDRQLGRSKAKVYGSHVPSKADKGKTAQTVYPPHPNVKQMHNWVNHPDRVDIKGIDAPDTALVTARHTVTVPKDVRRQLGYSANSKPDYTKYNCSGFPIYKIWESFGTYNVLAKNDHGEWVFGRNYNLETGLWQGGTYKIRIDDLYERCPPYGRLVVDNHRGPTGRY